jgi:hypothetical protein
MRFFFWLAELAKDRVIKQTSEIAADRHVSARNWNCPSSSAGDSAENQRLISLPGKLGIKRPSAE